MAKIYQSFEDVGVAGTVLYTKNVVGGPPDDIPILLPNGKYFEVNTTKHPCDMLFYDAEGTKPVFASELVELFEKGFVIKGRYDTAYSVPIYICGDYVTATYTDGTTDELAIVSYVEHLRGAGTTDPAFRMCVACPDPVVED